MEVERDPLEIDFREIPNVSISFSSLALIGETLTCSWAFSKDLAKTFRSQKSSANQI